MSHQSPARRTADVFRGTTSCENQIGLLFDVVGGPGEVVERPPQVRDSFFIKFAGTSDLTANGLNLASKCLAGRCQVDQNAPLIGYTSPGNMFADLQARGVPMTERNVRFATDSTVVAWEMVKKGLGIGVNMREVAAVTPDVEQVLPDFPPIPVPIWIVTHRELHTSRRIRLVFDLLAKAFSTLAR